MYIYIYVYKFLVLIIIIIIPPYNSKEEKKTCLIVEFAVPTDHKVKLKESEKKDKYLDLAREFKNCGT